MAKRVQLVLNQDVVKLGRMGDLVEVAPGYARNFLMPQGLAFKVTPGVLKQVERRREEELKRLAELKSRPKNKKKRSSNWVPSPFNKKQVKAIRCLVA